MTFCGDFSIKRIIKITQRFLNIGEQGKELFQPLPELSFSLYEKIKNGEAEYIEELSDWYEIYILLNDNEGVLVFIPRTLLPQHSLPMIPN